MNLAGWTIAIGMVLLIGLLSVPAWSVNSDRRSATPGTLNVQGGHDHCASLLPRELRFAWTLL